MVIVYLMVLHMPQHWSCTHHYSRYKWVPFIFCTITGLGEYIFLACLYYCNKL
jgi:hypothetical protein